MSEKKEEAKPKPKRSLAWKIGKVVLIVLGSLVLLVVLVALLLLTPPVQNFARKKVQAFMSSKLQTRFEIGRIYIGFPKKVVLENVYVEDRQKDTLLAGGTVRVDISMLKLLRSEVEIDQVELENITAKIKRQLPDTSFNFQFIIDAFAPKKATPVDTSAAAMKMSIKDVELDKIRVIYKDVITGNDMTVWLEHFDTHIDVFDMEKMRFSVPDFNVRGLTASIYQSKPLVTPEPASKDMAEAAAPIPFALDLENVRLEQIKLDYKNDVSAFYTNLNLGELFLEAEKLDLANEDIVINELRLDETTAAILLGNKPAAETVAKEVEQEIKSEAQNNWKILVKSLRLNNDNIKFDNNNEPKLNYGMDYAHLDARALTLHVDDFFFALDSIAGNIRRGEMTEKSGFTLKRLETDFLYASTGAHLHGLVLETPGTRIQRSLEIRYPSLEALQKNIGLMQLNLQLPNTRIQVKDILTFAPFLRSQPAFSNPSTTLVLNGDVSGSVGRLNIKTLQLQGLGNTRLDVKGTINGLPDPNGVNGRLDIASLRTTRRDIEAIMPRGSLPPTIALPEQINMRGHVAGSMANANADLDINTNLGSVSIDGSIRNATKPSTASYDATITTNNLDLGTILKNDTLYGPLNATFVASGSGLDLPSANANFRGTIKTVEYNKYKYSDIDINGTIARQVASVDLSSTDPNIDLNLNARADLSREFPSVALKGQVRNFNAEILNFTSEPLIFRANLDGDFPSTDPKNLEGNLLITQAYLGTADQKLNLDTIQLSAGKTDTGQFVRMQSEVLQFALTGQYNLTQLGYVFQDAIQPYFQLVPSYKKVPVDPYDFRFTATLTNGPLFKAFVPDLNRLEPITLQSRFSSTDGWYARAHSPLVIFGTNRMQNLRLDAGTGNQGIQLNVNLDQFGSGTMNLYQTTVKATVANNQVNFLLDINDKAAKDKYILGGNFAQVEPGHYTVSLNSDSLLLNYDRWTLSKDNLVRLNNGDINVRNFVLSKTGQSLSINSSSTASNSPLDIRFENFRIATITAFLKQDTVLADGRINGLATLSNFTGNPAFTSDLVINDLRVQNDTLGNFSIKANNTTPNVIAINAGLNGKDNELLIAGSYFVQPVDNNQFDIDLDIRQIQMSTIETLSMGAIRGAKGYVNGKFDIKGTIADPDLVGNLNFNKATLVLSMLGGTFQIDQEQIAINNEGIRFDSFTIRDSTNNSLVLDGMAYTDNFTTYRFDLTLTADNFQAMNSTKRDNRLFYGRLFFNTNLHISGTETNPKVDGALTINDKTDFTVVMPQAEPGVIEREGIVRFVDMDSIQVSDTVALAAAIDSLNQSRFSGMDIALNLEIVKEATFNLVIDEGNGDFIRMKGEAEITAGIDPSGKINLAGTYEIMEGSYELSFNFIRRKFTIQKGSKITWLGEPTEANVDVTAVYVANTAPLTLVEDQLSEQEGPTANYYKQKLPFEVRLKLGGEIMKPDISFDIVLPEGKNYGVDNAVVETVDTRLTQLREEPSEMNKQVFALLLLNRFVSENPFESSGGGSDAGTMARQSVSRLLTQQLNDLTKDLIHGVDLNFELMSTEDYTTGEMRNRTDLNVSVSKQLLSDRLKVTVGSNFELEGPQNANQSSANVAGNVALDYMLSKDGRYMIRGYRKNEYQGVVDGYIIETGLNFIITVDYEHFRDLFRKKKKPKPPAQPQPKADPVVIGADGAAK